MLTPAPITTEMTMKRDVRNRAKKVTMKTMTRRISPQQRTTIKIVKIIEEAEANALPAYSPQMPDPARLQFSVSEMPDEHVFREHRGML
jgi:hypothetical protein